MGQTLLITTIFYGSDFVKHFKQIASGRRDFNKTAF